jgi:hypothetical protein
MLFFINHILSNIFFGTLCSIFWNINLGEKGISYIYKHIFNVFLMPDVYITWSIFGMNISF